ncbi:MAG: DUF1569 domain-containing protein [Phycisphaerae bacterium]|jgi:hypothetical protein
MAQQSLVSDGFVGGARTKPSSPAKRQAPHRSLRWIPDQARRLAAGNVHRGRAWSLAEVCDHLALAFESTVRGSIEEAPPRRWQALGRFERVLRWGVKRFMLATGWFPSGASAPASVAPSNSVSLEEALSRLEEAAAAFARKCSSPRSTWGYHSLLGKMSGRAWRRFHSIHAAHHFSFFKAERGS